MSDDTVRKGYNCAWQIYFHIVFPVKNRRPLLESELAGMIVEKAEDTTERYAIEMEAVGCDKDHIQLLCGAHTNTALGMIVYIFKNITAREILRRNSAVKEHFRGGDFGQTATMAQQLVKGPTGIQ